MTTMAHLHLFCAVRSSRCFVESLTVNVLSAIAFCSVPEFTGLCNNYLALTQMLAEAQQCAGGKRPKNLSAAHSVFPLLHYP
ncbi:hypothetical protein GF036_07985 [Salmonella enterica subsp. enterica serovar Agona]|uniref:Uncharacterized protein n=7 Tax=Salmonella enterica TaxID=28901 RepID=A0A627DF22_SALET|nr:hypothetical protein [Salmonella enterica]EBP6723920.1 hypothetical protein [Salmonella enterica subsp. enterica]EDH9169034.1 hypothetical protein [Salmonella enterica subsp. enterica serovar Fallowfield]HAD0276689.1 hypothetical protein [Salmonella enterica subsp. enterica serovar Typhimurium]EAR9933414.1 hypothetical protein [Salmonella enterica]EAW3504508.1 hypothetical protein [Salmonella enterica]